VKSADPDTADASIPGVRGRLISGTFARELNSTVEGAEPAPAAFRRALDPWWRRCEATLGPASSIRTVADVALLPLLRLLGFAIQSRADGEQECRFELTGGARSGVVVAVAVGWSVSLSRGRRTAIEHAISSDAHWCLCCNGASLRIVDARRTWSRDYLEVDLAALAQEPGTQSLLWSLARADAMRGDSTVLDRAVVLSARRGVEVCRALGDGVLDALQLLLAAVAQRGARGYAPDLLFEHSLTMLYRVLFLLFAEGRGLVPMWHPVYRDRYSIEAIVDTLLSGRPYRGLWLAVQAISRLAHSGCAAGELRVTAFNGRLFSPSQAAAFERRRIDDVCLARAVIAVATTASRTGVRRRIAYRDLDVEQLGAVYERVLDYQPGAAGTSTPLVRTGDRRKATGTFYTPRAVAGYLVRRTLDPLLAGRSADEMLNVRILDPAMGSGAFLVAACRHLAAAVEDALIVEGRWHPHDVTTADRVLLRRQIASRCLYGVDLNPMAVQLARLSLWLATLSADRPLSFLDHHLVAGDSLVGARPADLVRQPSADGRRRRRASSLTLLDDSALAAALGDSVRRRMKLAADPDDSAAVVRAKERTLAAMQDRDAALGRWRRALDLWCAGWFWRDGRPPDRGTFAALVDDLLHRRPTLARHVAAPILGHADGLAAHHRFLHWPLIFPEVFVDDDGEALAGGGFDAIVGNPPWDMVRGDSGDGDLRAGRRFDAERLTSFVRESGIYRVESRAHANRYQLFVERALQLVRPGGRIGLVLPSGVATDAGAAPLRRHLFEHADVDEIAGLDNRGGIFPIHRSVRFALVTCSAGRPTAQIRCRFGISNPEDLERSDSLARQPIVLTRRFLVRLSGAEDLGIPELTGAADLRLLERISATVPPLGSTAGWDVHFGRELNASDDRDAFVALSGEPSARPIVEGKQIEPFRAALDRSRQQLRADCDVGARAPRRARLAYRDIASATNRLTLIAAVLPARAVTTHTLFCLKTPLAEDAQHVLCSLMNSYVANYLIRLRVNTHVTVALVSRLPVPVVRPGDPWFERLSELSRALAGGTGPIEEAGEYAELQSIAARLYGLTAADFEHVLGTFPLVAATTKERALRNLIALRGDDTPRL
jgi:hypothetical protein